MGSVVLASLLPATGHPSSSHHHCQDVIIDIDIIDIDFITFVILLLLVAVVVGGSSNCIIALVVVVAIANAFSTIILVVGDVINTVDIVAPIAVIVVVIVIFIIIVLIGSKLKELDQTMLQWHCPWHANGPPTLGLSHGCRGADMRLLLE
jgi:hypothetical protein